MFDTIVNFFKYKISFQLNLHFSEAKKRPAEESTVEEKQQEIQQQQPKTKKKKKEKEKTLMDEEKEAAIAAEVKAARERALVPLEIRMKQFKDMLLERGVSIKHGCKFYFILESHRKVLDPN